MGKDTDHVCRYSRRQITAVRDIPRRFQITDIDATGPVADELVVAIPLSSGVGPLIPEDKFIVVTEESKGGRGSRRFRMCVRNSGSSYLAERRQATVAWRLRIHYARIAKNRT